MEPERGPLSPRLREMAFGETTGSSKVLGWIQNTEGAEAPPPSPLPSSPPPPPRQTISFSMPKRQQPGKNNRKNKPEAGDASRPAPRDAPAHVPEIVPKDVDETVPEVPDEVSRMVPGPVPDNIITAAAYAYGPSRKYQAWKTNAEYLKPDVYETVKKYCEWAPDSQDPAWTRKPEYPSSKEVMDDYNWKAERAGEENSEPSGSSRSKPAAMVPLEPNHRTGGYDSQEHYLRVQYELLREDSTRPLREAVVRVREEPFKQEREYGNSIGVYENVRIVSMMFTNRGITSRVQFSLSRLGMKVPWLQSRRLLTGSIVALTPMNDMFREKCVVAAVAARPLQGLTQSVPEIDLMFARPDEMEIDPAVPWVMVEDRKGYYEADRTTLMALQKMHSEPFPLQQYLVKLKPDIDPPKYLPLSPRLDLTTIFQATDPANPFEHIGLTEKTFCNVDFRATWNESWPHGDLDRSQLSALKHMLTKEVAMIQGPPGTGKTYVSVLAIQTLLQNRDPENDAPIVVACQTNHALDQFLRFIDEFEPRFVRLGSRSQDENIRNRMIRELKKDVPMDRRANDIFRTAKNRMQAISDSVNIQLAALKLGGVVDPNIFNRLGLISKAQLDSLEHSPHAVTGTKNAECSGPIVDWVGDHLVSVPRGIEPDQEFFEWEEAEEESEEIEELEAERIVEADFWERLHGDVVTLADNFTGRQTVRMTDEEISHCLREPDLWKIQPKFRGPIFSYLQRKMKQILLQKFREYAIEYTRCMQDRKFGLWLKDSVVLQNSRIIGVTLTGLSKYRGLIAGMKPKIILVEEAAEALEPLLVPACFPTVEHLILVGDHKQLRPRCHSNALEGRPFFFNMSLFERLVINKVSHSTLRTQRRMTPEISRLLRAIYKDTSIKDHSCVKDRESVPGMGGVNTWFMSHTWLESKDSNMSTYNLREAKMVAGFYEYLCLNGVDHSQISILTFYNGQRKKILQELRCRPNLKDMNFIVSTIDSYQGEENEIILLSLVRSNDNLNIGFLAGKNRICVAISRARRGFYMFGDADFLTSANATWREIIKMLEEGTGLKKKDAARRIEDFLPIMCEKHRNEVEVSDERAWDDLGGGCGQSCGEVRECGHNCRQHCHPYPHDRLPCPEKGCNRKLNCGHKCAAKFCNDPCFCDCKKPQGDFGTRTSKRRRSPRKKEGSPKKQKFHQCDRPSALARTSQLDGASEEGWIQHRHTQLAAKVPAENGRRMVPRDIVISKKKLRNGHTETLSKRIYEPAEDMTLLKEPEYNLLDLDGPKTTYHSEEPRSANPESNAIFVSSLRCEIRFGSPEFS
ncbi:P-loop containing nucleoside triphosphate hydrolase protein [Lineolata rhizophorae]|uniref:P-loop containing nucleoside triphosphate hydrolase protein n=1 Tax=Lineolata rhizophorae TaxID=578093 RepID=A0A6A6NQ83_9PEZI|nr:P-loop containing nucleoside triphosphate hydrolase protein [Lineolata rhizophorae]